MSAARAQALMSIDVEDWFQVENLRGVIARESWDSRELRVERSTRGILDSLGRANARATFFFLGWVAERLPRLVRDVHAAGHEVGCHGYGHRLLPELGESAFREDVARAKSILEDLTGEAVTGYRAPSFSITDWAIDHLADLGFRYDSSLFWALERHGRFTRHEVRDAPVFELRKGFHEVRLSCLPVPGGRLPWAGGGYFRLIPYPVFRQGVRRILERTGVFSFYTHPWEFDPGQPRVRGIRRSFAFRHYNNLDKTARRFERLLSDFSFAPVRSILPPAQAGAATGVPAGAFASATSARRSISSV